MSDTGQRDYYFESLKRFSDFLPYENWSKFTIEFANLRLDHLESMWKHLLTYAGDTKNNRPFDEAKRMYCRCKATLHRHILELKSAADDSPTPSETSDLNVDFRESEINLLNEIGIFDGDFTRWYDFRNGFIENVHENAALRNAQKLIVLKTVVTERAARVLGKWQSTDANYELAWQKLCDVYNNQYQIARAHIRSLQTMPRLEPPEFDGIFGLIDRVTYAQRQLSTMGVPVDSWDLWIVYLVEERLDDRCRHAWTEYRESNKIILPNWNEMRAFLQRRAVISPVAQLPASGSFLANFSDVENFGSIAKPRNDVTDELMAIKPRNETSTQKSKYFESPPKKKCQRKPMAIIDRKHRRRCSRKLTGTGVNRMNIGDCIVCKISKNTRFVNCNGCPARGHLTCVRNLMDTENHEWNWKCPKCLKCDACNDNHEMGTLYKCTACHKRYHLSCLEDKVAMGVINSQDFKCKSCLQLSDDFGN